MAQDHAASSRCGFASAAIGSVIRGDLSFQTQEQATPNGYSIDHVVGLGHTSLILLFASTVFFVVSFMIPPKRV